MQFSLKWAATSGVYTGMLFGLARVGLGFTDGTFSLNLLGFGLLAGGAIGIPLSVSHLAAAYVASRLKAATFWFRFGLFALLSLPLYFAILGWLNRSMRVIGGVMHGQEAVMQQVGFFAASVAVALFSMYVAAASARRRTPLT